MCSEVLLCGVWLVGFVSGICVMYAQARLWCLVYPRRKESEDAKLNRTR